MNKNTSISLGDYFESFVRNSIAQGRYKNASEVISPENSPQLVAVPYK